MQQGTAYVPTVICSNEKGVKLISNRAPKMAKRFHTK